MCQNHIQGWFIKIQIAGSTHRVSGSVALGWGPIIFIFNFPRWCYLSQDHTWVSLLRRKDIVKEKKRRGADKWGLDKRDSRGEFEKAQICMSVVHKMVGMEFSKFSSDYSGSLP